MTRLASVVVLVLALSVLLPPRLCSAAPANSAGSPEEYQVKAAFLYNFAKFIQWPPDGRSHLLIGVFGEDPFGDLLERIIAGKMVQGREIKVIRVSREEDLRGCHMVFIAAAESQRSAEVLARLSAGVLTVGESPHFLREGGVIRFFTDSNRVRFQINAARAEQRGLKISSQLLSLARQ